MGKIKKGKKEKTTNVCDKRCTVVANVNNSCSPIQSVRETRHKDLVLKHANYAAPQKQTKRLKSKAVVPERSNTTEIVRFEENDEMIEMEIYDGGAAAEEFASDGETPSDKEYQSGVSEDEEEDEEHI